MALPERHSDRPLKPLCHGTLEGSAKFRRRLLQQSLRSSWSTRDQLVRCGGEAPCGPAAGVRCQLSGTGEERGAGRIAAASAGPFRTVLQLGGHLLVRGHRSPGEMPGSPVRVPLGIRRRCQRPVRLPAPGDRGAMVYG